MTGYVVRRLTDRRLWTGAPDGWSPHRADARVFEFMTTAIIVGNRDGAGDPADFAIDPVFVEDQAIFYREAA